MDATDLSIQAKLLYCVIFKIKIIVVVESESVPCYFIYIRFIGEIKIR